MGDWTSDELERLDAAQELLITTVRADGTPRRAVPIWVVCVDGHAYVRTWHRRDTGWFGHAVRSQRAHVSVPGLDADVAVSDVGAGPAERRAGVDAAYRAKYGGSAAERMAGDEAAATTLGLHPSRE